MARPRKQGLDYFPHDVDASNDEKIEALRALYGNDGYAFYFIMLERIYRTPNFELDVSEEFLRQILAKKVAVTPQKFEEMLETALKLGCFDQEAYEKRGVLTSPGIKKRAEIVVKKREKMRQRYEKAQVDRGDYVSGGVSDRVSAAETREETPESKVKKREDSNINNISLPYREDNNINNITPPIISPPYGEIIEYLNHRAGTRFRSTSAATQRLIKARWREGFTLDDFKRVIDNKVAAWKGTEMEQYLRPQTLFGTKFEAYLNEKPKPKLAWKRSDPVVASYAPGQDPNKEVL